MSYVEARLDVTRVEEGNLDGDFASLLRRPTTTDDYFLTKSTLAPTLDCHHPSTHHISKRSFPPPSSIKHSHDCHQRIQRNQVKHIIRQKLFDRREQAATYNLSSVRILHSSAGVETVSSNMSWQGKGLTTPWFQLKRLTRLPSIH